MLLSMTLGNQVCFTQNALLGVESNNFAGLLFDSADLENDLLDCREVTGFDSNVKDDNVDSWK